MLSQEMLALGNARSAIRELYEFGVQRAKEVGAKNVFDFSLGNPSAPPPDIVNQTIVDILTENPHAIHGYTSAQGCLPLRSSLAEWVSQSSGMCYQPDNFYITAGAAAALTCTICALACEGDEFIVLTPFFPEYTVYIARHGGKAVLVPTREGDFQLDLEAIEAALTPKTKAIIINTPNNPSGAIYAETDLIALGSLLNRKSIDFGAPIYLISDEPYREISYEKEVPWIPKTYQNTIVCYSYSKSLSLAGERIGYVLIGEQVADWQELYFALSGAVRALGYTNPPSLIQNVVARCGNITASFDDYRKNRDILVDALGKLGFELGTPEGAFYLMPKCLEEDATAFCEKAKEFDLLLVPSDSFGIKGHFRLAYCVPTDRVLHSLPRFKKLVEFYRG